MCQERELFLRFTWGRSRMPPGKLPQKFVVDTPHVHGNPDTHLPTVATCFFQLHLPSYSSKADASHGVGMRPRACEGKV